MKKLLFALAGILSLLLLTWVIGWGFAVRSERKASLAFAEIAPDAALVEHYPLVDAKNDAAQRIEALALPLAVDLRPRSENVDSPQLDGELKQSMSDWLTAQHERTDDTITPIPENVKAWLDANRTQIDELARFLNDAETPRWPQRQGTGGERLTQPLPNLLGHMILFKVFSVAALDRAAAGDHAAAWEFLHAGWKLDHGLRARREVISELIAVAGAKLIATSARKLDPPTPAWFAELSERRFSDAVYDAVRFESAEMAAAVRESPRWVFADTQEASLVATSALWPLARWAVAENNRALHELLPSIAAAGPCLPDAKMLATQLRSGVPDLAAKIGMSMNEHVPNAVWRGAHADLVIEGTNRILALKAARAAAGGQWPQSFAAEASSRCPGERWAYAASPEGPVLQFTSALAYPERFVGAKIPMEYRAAPSAAK